MLVILFCIFLANLNFSNGQELHEKITVTEISGALLKLLGMQAKSNWTNANRMAELKDKLSRINSYVIDKEKYSQLLLNETRHSTLNQTNFYSALKEKDYFQTMTNDTRSLYLKLKERMNRDDVIRIMSERGEKKMKKSARRMMNDEFVPNHRSERRMEEMVDKYLGEAAVDNHHFDQNDRYQKVWDPQTELEERRTYHQHDGRRIFKGERTTIRYYPFMVSVHVMGRFWCGGSLFWNDIVLTSASCLQLMHNNRFFRENPKVLFVRVGSNHSRVGGESIEALEVYFHPAYNPNMLKNNIAVIRLRRHILFTYHRVPKIIPISHETGGVPFTAEVLLLGWGVSKTSQKLAYDPVFLQRKILPIYPNKFCKEVYGDKFITESMFCAGTLTTGEGACDHDAGGPAVMNGMLVGIISFGPAVCGFPDAPTVFTLVGPFSDWIETINETMPEYYRAYKRTTTTAVPLYLEYFRTIRDQVHEDSGETTAKTLTTRKGLQEAHHGDRPILPQMEPEKERKEDVDCSQD